MWYMYTYIMLIHKCASNVVNKIKIWVLKQPWLPTNLSYQISIYTYIFSFTQNPYPTDQKIIILHEDKELTVNSFIFIVPIFLDWGIPV